VMGDAPPKRWTPRPVAMDRGGGSRTGVRGGRGGTRRRAVN
jgi:hypothetical protein